MFVTIYTDNLVHLCGFKINHFIMSENRIRNLLNINFIDSEQARNFKHYINYCNIYNKGCNLVLFNSNLSERNCFIKTYTKNIMFDCRWVFCHCSMIERPRRINDNLLKISLLYDYDYGEKGSKYEIMNTCTNIFRNILNNLIDNLETL